jgi:hypothetical protein
MAHNRDLASGAYAFSIITTNAGGGFGGGGGGGGGGMNAPVEGKVGKVGIAYVVRVTGGTTTDLDQRWRALQIRIARPRQHGLRRESIPD